MWEVFKQYHTLLNQLGVGELTQNTIDEVDKFICRIYNVQKDILTTNQAPFHLFARANKPEALPSTSDALKLHIMRTHYQSLVWNNSSCAQPDLPLPTNCGWINDGRRLIPLLMTKSPIPDACHELLSCQCKTGCQSRRCNCVK